MNRRGFLTGMAGILASGTAPWVVTSAGVLMPVRKLIVPTSGKSIALKYYEQTITIDQMRKHDFITLADIELLKRDIDRISGIYGISGIKVDKAITRLMGSPYIIK